MRYVTQLIEFWKLPRKVYSTKTEVFFRSLVNANTYTVISKIVHIYGSQPYSICVYQFMVATISSY